ncbi:MAG: Bax inhibitor-1/YccA family protein [Alphaproteobacteria bacterium]|nr:Bax inhibitor-1/YccA family protein [Alphaproteobacteria bacterium]
MNSPFYNQTAQGARVGVATDEGLRAHMLRIYNYMASAVLLSGIVAFVIASSPVLTALMVKSPLRWVFMLAPIAFIFIMSWRFERMSKVSLQAMFWAYAACIGVSFAAILLYFTGASVARAFFMAAGLFAGLSLYGYTTKADLSKLGTILMVGMVVVFLASIVNIFLGSSALQFAVSIVGLLVFLGLTAWDTQRIKDTYVEYAGTEFEGKIAVMDSLGLYINFVAIFQFLISLTGQRDE